MTRLSRKKHRAAVYGWVKWTPALLAVFSVAFVDIMLNVESRKIDYQLGALKAEEKELDRVNEELEVIAESRANVNRLTERARELGLRQAEADQTIRIVAVPEEMNGVFALQQVDAPTIDPPGLAYETAATLVDTSLELTPVPELSLDESPEAMLASL